MVATRDTALFEAVGLKTVDLWEAYDMTGSRERGIGDNEEGIEGARPLA